jgi:hypothetical protein
MEINKVSNPDKVKVNLEKYYGKDVEIYLSTRKGKKYMIVNKEGKKIHFGDINYMLIILNTWMKKGDNHLGIGMKNGKMLNLIPQHICLIIYYGDLKK